MSILVTGRSKICRKLYAHDLVRLITDTAYYFIPANAEGFPYAVVLSPLSSKHSIVQAAGHAEARPKPVPNSTTTTTSLVRRAPLRIRFGFSKECEAQWITPR